MDNSQVSYTLKIAESEGRVAAYFPDDFMKYVDTQLNCRPVVQNRDDGQFIFGGWVFWSREDNQSEHPPGGRSGIFTVRCRPCQGKISRSTLKRVCRGYGFPRWPPRKKKMVGSSQPSESSLGVDHQLIP
ncbi:uncharacterized protein LOC114312026 isoform X5 [Camellia sinensis]|uniref:uncharacterized protein LOC114312026 isoform X5 n=1 Tax=Camellia sinensis TaxID=4442 RepID=UPI0010356D07|nr:uncharacterized protein LOC114312026 isoform X5 [Camellia sinensis]